MELEETDNKIITLGNKPQDIKGWTGNDLERAAAAANQAAADYIFNDYYQRRSVQTLRTHLAALHLWVNFLYEIKAAGKLISAANNWARDYGHSPIWGQMEEYAKERDGDMTFVFAANFCQHRPEAWQGVTWGLVEGFVKWLLNSGYSIVSVNNRLATIKVYTRLAAKASIIPPTEHALIREVRGYGQTEGKRIDEKRPLTRIGYKKEENIILTSEQARRLKNDHPPTPQGIRDRLLMSLFLDLGLRVSEVAAIKVEDLSEAGHIIVYRQKTDTTDRLKLSADLLQALTDYKPFNRQSGILLRGSRKNGQLTDHIMSVRALNNRVKVLGRDILGIWELSPHDLRHTWATEAAKQSNPFALRDAGGWTNMQTPSRYVERSKVANEGIQLDY